MSRYIAFLRAINVGGHTVKMDQLRGLFEEAGFRNVETFIASGNVVFEARTTNRKQLEKKIEKKLLDALGYEVVTFVRTDKELAEIAIYQPFSDAAVASWPTFCVGFLRDPLDTERTRKLMSLRSDIDDFNVNGSEIYWLCKLGQGDATFSNNAFEKLTGARTTFRGVNTIRRMAKKYAAE